MPARRRRFCDRGKKPAARFPLATARLSLVRIHYAMQHSSRAALIRPTTEFALSTGAFGGRPCAPARRPPLRPGRLAQAACTFQCSGMLHVCVGG